MTPVERIEYDQAVLQLREQTDETPLAQKWAEGRGMTMEQAIEFALH